MKGGADLMKRHRHTPEQAVRKLHEGERMLNEGQDKINNDPECNQTNIDQASTTVTTTASWPSEGP